MNLLFDLDGTLADPMEAIAGSMHFAFEQLGLTRLSHETVRTLIGPPLHLELPKLLGPGRADLAPEVMRLYRQHHGETGIYLYKFFEGVDRALAAVGPGNRIFVATSKPRFYADIILSHFGKAHFFEYIYGSELSGVNAKKGDLIRFAIGERSLRPEETVMIGDRKHDVLGAAENGIPTVGVLWGYGSDAELKQAGARATVDTWDALVGELKKNTA
ncbi:MAG: HAD hydrolase-like protein [Deltaproteobacteria bacterium]|nr:HAD hydrolase-like protein [Deltaproteobacteria bacterium]